MSVRLCIFSKASSLNEAFFKDFAMDHCQLLRRPHLSFIWFKPDPWIQYETTTTNDKNCSVYWGVDSIPACYFFYHFAIWLNTVLRAVSDNSRAGAFVKLDKQTWRRKSNGTQKTNSQIYSLKFCDIWQNFYFYCIWNNENFKMEGEQTNFVTHLTNSTIILLII